MNSTYTYTSFDQLPLTLQAKDVAAVLRISRSQAYTLMHRSDFPMIRIGKRMLVARDQFLSWLNCQTESLTHVSGK